MDALKVNLSKPKIIKRISKIVKIERTTYTVLHIVPDTSVRDYNTENISEAISTLYRDLKDRQEIIIRGKKHNMLRGIYYEDPIKVNFLIQIKKGENNTNFYMTVPDRYKSMLKEKCSAAWPQSAIYEMKELPISAMPVNYELMYVKEDALSLKCDKRTNQPVASILNVLDILEDGEEVNLFYNFTPLEQLSWRNKYRDTMQKIKIGKSIDRNKISMKYMATTGLDFVVNEAIQPVVGEAIRMFTGDESNFMQVMKNKSATKAGLEFIRNLSHESVTKVDSRVIGTQIVVGAKGGDKKRMRNVCLSVCESFKVLNEDNTLRYKLISPKNFNYRKGICNLAVNKMSTAEVANFIQLPGREVLKAYPTITQVGVLQTVIPKSLQLGELCIGVNEYKNLRTVAYLTTHKDYKRLALCIVGPTRSGKTTLISNLNVNALNAKQCNIILDFIETCKLSTDVERVIPKDKVLRINCDKDIQGFGYNEITIDNEFPWEAYKGAKLKTAQVVTFMNSVNADDKDLKNKMERYFEAASLVVFIQNGSINDIFSVLRDHVIRGNYINTIPKVQLNKLTEYISTLKELDELDSKTGEVKGTKLHLVAGIFDRLHKLKKNPFMELMLSEGCENNINLVEEISKNQTIFIRMPEIMLPTEEERDILTTYWVTKIWLALQVRANNIEDVYARGIVNIFVDELGQVPHAQEFIRSKLSQCAKFGGKFILSCMYLSQIPIIRTELIGANTSYMLISGCDKGNYKELKEELQPYQLEHLLKLPEHHCLNLIKYEGGYARFITKLPGPLKGAK